MEQAKDIATTILFLPSRFNSSGNDQSIYSLLQATGYFELYDQIQEDQILEALYDHLECADQWMKWSEDKRSASGWYFIQNEQGSYVVGYYPEQDDLETIEYIDKTEACALYIKREIEEIRKY